MQKQFLEAGKIVGTHGVRGDLRAQSWCDSPETLCEFDTLYFDNQQKVTVQRAAVHKNVVLLHLAGVDTIEAAEALRGRTLYIDRAEVELPEDLVFVQDILGFSVFDERTNATLGHLRDVLSGAQDLYEIERDGGALVYIPAVKPFLKHIDMEQKVITIESIEGLYEN